MKRNIIFITLIIISAIVFISRLFYLQIIVGSNQDPIDSQTVKIEYDYPERGYIYDRNGKIMVANQLSYDVMLIPKELKSLDTLELCNLLKIDPTFLKKKIKKAIRKSKWQPYKILSQLSKEDYAYLQEKIYKYKGFYIQKRIIRNYPQKIAANIVGYISEVKESQIRKDPYYQQSELIGAWGVEKQYEKILRGQKGKKYYNRNNHNAITGDYKNGKYNTEATPGKDLTLTIDSKLQAYGEKLMKGKRGGIVAIEPKTGEILALVTAPTYDPNLMVGRKRARSSVKLFYDTINNPMLDRGLQAMYPPGSPFKILNGLIALEEGVITKNFGVVCNHGYKYGRNLKYFMGCHCGAYGATIRLKRAISHSCNTYFATIYRKIIDKAKNSQAGLDNWARHLNSFGLGNYLGYDLPVGQKGSIPTSKIYNRAYNFNWGATTTISNAIGQGEVLTTPIQLANATAAIANRGYFYTPHIVKEIDHKPITNPNYTKRKNTTIHPEHFEIAIEGMHDVFKIGTGRFSQVPNIEICGKTGTSENFTKIDGQRIKLEDHSILIAFAPKENPKIALAVFIENGGYGSTIAAPITSLMIEKYINGEVKRTEVEERMLNLDLSEIYKKSIPKNIETESE